MTLYDDALLFGLMDTMSVSAPTFPFPLRIIILLFLMVAAVLIFCKQYKLLKIPLLIYPAILIWFQGISPLINIISSRHLFGEYFAMSIIHTTGFVLISAGLAITATVMLFKEKYKPAKIFWVSHILWFVFVDHLIVMLIFLLWR